MVAEGYDALCDFFRGDRQSDPRLEPSFQRKTAPKRPPRKRVRPALRKPVKPAAHREVEAVEASVPPARQVRRRTVACVASSLLED